MSEVTAELDRLVARLEAAEASRVPARGDAIDEALEQPARRTEVRAVSASAEMEAFRRELIDGLIRADTANRLLRLVAEIVERML